MSKARTLLILGVWVAILPYLGFPLLLKNLLFVATGLVFIYLSYKFYKEAKLNMIGERVFENFSENLNPKEDEAI